MRAEQNDNRQLVGMVDQIRRNTGHNPRELSADHGYFSDGNLKALRRHRIRGYIATGRELGAETSPRRRALPRGPLATEMHRRIKRGGYRSRYRLRKQIVEPVFGQVRSARQLSRFSLRGLRSVGGEWALICTAHNLLKLARR